MTLSEVSPYPPAVSRAVESFWKDDPFERIHTSVTSVAVDLISCFRNEICGVYWNRKSEEKGLGDHLLLGVTLLLAPIGNALLLPIGLIESLARAAIENLSTLWSCQRATYQSARVSLYMALASGLMALAAPNQFVYFLDYYDWVRSKLGAADADIALTDQGFLKRPETPNCAPFQAPQEPHGRSDQEYPFDAGGVSPIVPRRLDFSAI